MDRQLWDGLVSLATSRWCGCCWRRAPTSTQEENIVAPRCSGHPGGATSRWCGFWSLLALLNPTPKMMGLRAYCPIPPKSTVKQMSSYHILDEKDEDDL